MAVFFKPLYGYVYQRFYKTGPEWYAFGISCDLKYGDSEAKIIGSWSRNYDHGKYHTGDMRDIYPLNILSASHNQRMIDGVVLFDWINADPERGALTELAQNLWSWWVEDGCVAQKKIRA